MINFSKEFNSQIEDTIKQEYRFNNTFDSNEYFYMNTDSFKRLTKDELSNCISTILLFLDGDDTHKERIMNNLSLKRFKNRNSNHYGNFTSRFLTSELNPLYYEDIKENFEKQALSFLTSKAFKTDFVWGATSIYPEIILTLNQDYIPTREEILQLKQLIASFFSFKRVVKREKYSYNLTQNSKGLYISMMGADISQIKSMKA